MDWGNAFIRVSAVFLNCKFAAAASKPVAMQAGSLLCGGVWMACCVCVRAAPSDDNIAQRSDAASLVLADMILHEKRY